MNTAAIMFLGVALGTFSKFLDNTPGNELPFIFESLDIANFLGRFAIWILLAVCISVYSVSPTRASINVFAFFSSMVTSYYLYSAFVAGFFPKSYAMIWVGFTIVSPVLAFICWFAKGQSKISLVLSAGILAVLFNMTFIYGFLYFNIVSPLELLTFICGFIIMRRKMVRETISMTLIGAALAFVLNAMIPFQFF